MVGEMRDRCSLVLNLVGENNGVNTIRGKLGKFA